MSVIPIFIIIFMIIILLFVDLSLCDRKKAAILINAFNKTNFVKIRDV